MIKYFIAVICLSVFIAGCAGNGDEKPVAKTAPAAGDTAKPAPAPAPETAKVPYSIEDAKTAEELTNLGIYYIEKPDYENALKCFAKIIQTVDPHDGTAYYNLACIYSLMKDTQRALKCLEGAAAFGYDDVEFMEKDTDLDNIRNEDGYKAVVEALKNRPAKQ
ncbi:MAG: hypothetical protein HZA48_02110 [Planctomycetes bacterium]|nr:hypothetical protein [Planctomycetota bacterium]